MRVEIHIVGDEQIEVAVAVVIQKAASRSPALAAAGYARLLGNITKRAISVIAVQNVLAPVADKQIIESVVVVVADAAALAPARMGQAGVPGDVGKRAVAIVVK